MSVKILVFACILNSKIMPTGLNSHYPILFVIFGYSGCGKCGLGILSTSNDDWVLACRNIDIYEVRMGKKRVYVERLDKLICDKNLTSG